MGGQVGPEVDADEFVAVDDLRVRPGVDLHLLAVGHAQLVVGDLELPAHLARAGQHDHARLGLAGTHRR